MFTVQPFDTANPWSVAAYLIGGFTACVCMSGDILIRCTLILFPVRWDIAMVYRLQSVPQSHCKIPRYEGLGYHTLKPHADVGTQKVLN